MAHDPTTFAAVQPLDAHNRRLLETVHPPLWKDPVPPRDGYQLVVIGAGTAGLVTAAIAAGLGARVALIERELMGGDCLNVGCVPSKAMIAAARASHAAWTQDASVDGDASSSDGGEAFRAAVERMRRIRADLSPVDGAKRFQDDLGVDVYLGDARFVADDAVEVGGARLKFLRAVIATGGRAAVPDVPGLADSGYLTNQTFYSLTERPGHLAILGGGPIGCEMAQAVARLGGRVTIIETGGRLLKNDDPDAARIVAEALQRDGVEVLTEARVDSVSGRAGSASLRVTQGGAGRTIDATHVLVATGRAPNVEGLGLEQAAVEADEHGIAVDDRMRTSNPRIYAIGDVASKYKFTHMADASARMVVRNALFRGRGKASSLVVPWATYTSPEVAHVGITAAEVEEAGDEVQTITVEMADVDRARLDGRTEGFVRVHLKAGSDTILGATIVAERAGDLISQITQAMTAEIGLGKLGEVIYPYPTTAEAIRKAADQWRRAKLTPTAKTGLSLVLRLLR